MRQRISLILITFIVSIASIRAHAAAEPEERLKTAFIFQFAKYIEWPEEKDSPSFSISLVGQSPMWKFLQELAREKKVKEKPISLNSANPQGSPPKSNIVVFSEMSDDSIAQVLKHTKGTHALTISQGEGLAGKGVIINFYMTHDGRLRFEINRKAAEAEGLVISSQLLKMARIVE